MYDRLTGTIIERSLTEIVIEIGGVGYVLTVPLSTSNALPSSGQVTLFAHLHVREDQLRLFGFATRTERQLFRMLMGVSGIGPAIALAVLSGSTAEQFRSAVECSDCAFLSRIKGIGRKTAERIIVDLREPIKLVATESAPKVSERERMCRDAALALQSLGYTRAAAEKAVQNALDALGEKAARTEDLVRASLKFA
jgi:Holliday junction DNA helicase RuvA